MSPSRSNATTDLKAVGIFTGIRGNGIVFLDVDRNLKRCMKQWGESLAGAPMVTSTKQNAAKFIFRVPEKLWKEVKGRGLGKEDYEILWGARASFLALTPVAKL